MPQIAHEVRLLRALRQHHGRLHAKACEDARRAEVEAAEAEAALVFAMDRASFASEQMGHLTASAGPVIAMEEVASRSVLEGHRVRQEAAEEAARQRQDLLAELSERRSRSAAAVARLRLLRALCALSGTGPGTTCGLASLLWRCEEALLSGGGLAAGATLQPSVEALAAEFEAVSPFSLVLPILQAPHAKPTARDAEALADAQPLAPGAGSPIGGGSLGSRGRWLLAASSPPQPPSARPPAAEIGVGGAISAGAGDSEEAGLRKTVEDLTGRQRVLRAELQEARDRGRRREAHDDLHSSGSAGAARTTSVVAGAAAEELRQRHWAEAAALRRELADCYERLAELDDNALEEELVGLRAGYEEAKAEHALLEDQGVLPAAVAAPSAAPAAPAAVPAAPAAAAGSWPLPEPEHSSATSRQSSRSKPSAASVSPRGSPEPATARSGQAPPRTAQRLKAATSRLKTAEFAALQRHGSAALRRLRPDPADPGIGSLPAELAVPKPRAASVAGVASPQVPVSASPPVPRRGFGTAAHGPGPYIGGAGASSGGPASS